MAYRSAPLLLSAYFIIDAEKSLTHGPCDGRDDLGLILSFFSVLLSAATGISSSLPFSPMTHHIYAPGLD